MPLTLFFSFGITIFYKKLMLSKSPCTWDILSHYEFVLTDCFPSCLPKKEKIPLYSISVFLAFKLVLLSSCHLFQVMWLSRIRNNWVIFKIILNCGFLFRCSTADSRLAAYEVLVMLADSSPSNLQLITKELLSMHHQCDPALTKEFDVSK